MAAILTNRGKYIWLGALASPLPMVLFWLTVTALTEGISWMFVAFAVVACLTVWVPLLVSCGILRLASWRSLRAHLGVMFIATFVPMLSVYRFSEFSPDSTFTYEFNNSGQQVVEFALAGVVIAVIVALINTTCMLIFWRVAVLRNDVQILTPL